MAVGRVGFTQHKCEVTVCYCDKIEQGPVLFQGVLLARARDTVIWANFVMRAEPKLPASLCVSGEKLL